MVKKEDFKNSYTNKIKQNLEFFTEYKYIYKKNKLFNQLSNENDELYKNSKNKKNLTNKDYKKLYNIAVDISYGIDHIADTVGLFTKKIKKPMLESPSILDVKFDKSDSRHLDFICGDLYLRKNIIFKKDLLFCYKDFTKIVDKIQNKLTKFSWQMSYHMPSNKNEVNKLVNTRTKKHNLLTGPIWIFPINYNMNLGDIYSNKKKNDNILYIAADLIWTDLKAISQLTKKLKNLKEIIFIDYEIAFQPAKFKHKKGLINYIIEDCNNINFGKRSLTPDIKFTFHENKPNEYNYHLIKLNEFRKKIDKKVSIYFLNENYSSDQHQSALFEARFS